MQRNQLENELINMYREVERLQGFSFRTNTQPHTHTHTHSLSHTHTHTHTHVYRFVTVNKLAILKITKKTVKNLCRAVARLCVTQVSELMAVAKRQTGFSHLSSFLSCYLSLSLSYTHLCIGNNVRTSTYGTLPVSISHGDLASSVDRRSRASDRELEDVRSVLCPLNLIFYVFVYLGNHSSACWR